MNEAGRQLAPRKLESLQQRFVRGPANLLRWVRQGQDGAVWIWVDAFGVSRRTVMRWLREARS